MPKITDFGKLSGDLGEYESLALVYGFTHGLDAGIYRTLHELDRENTCSLYKAMRPAMGVAEDMVRTSNEPDFIEGVFLASSRLADTFLLGTPGVKECK